MILRLHVADTFSTRIRGLSRKKSLAANEGLLIRFPFPFFWPIWMRGMRFPIDVVWLRCGKVIDWRTHLSPSSRYHMHIPRRCADACVEVAAGEIKKYHLTVGAVIEFQIVDLDV